MPLVYMSMCSDFVVDIIYDRFTNFGVVFKILLVVF